MKKKNIFIVLSLALSMLISLTACTSDDSMSEPKVVKMENGFYVQDVDFICEAPGYDQGTTRAVTYNWNNGATILARFKSGSSYYQGFLVLGSNGWVMYSTSEFNSQSRSGTCELYYFQQEDGDYYHINLDTQCFDVYNNGSFVRSTDIKLTESTLDLSDQTAVYTTTTATYSTTETTYTIKATLTPYFWRMRFNGTNGTSITMPGNDNDIKYCSAFNWSSSAISFTKAAKDVSLTVSGSYTPYIYGEFKNPSSNNNITVKNGNDTYTRSFNGSNLKAGTSGYFTIPTASNYSSNGWKKESGGVLFEEPYCGWATSLSTVQAVVASMGYTTNYNTESSYLMCSAKNQEVAIYYNFEKERLDYVDIWFYESEATVSDVRNYLSSTLNYTYIGSNTANDGTLLYYYDSPDKVTRAYVYRLVASSGSVYTIVVFYGITEAIIFEEPYTNWGASQATTKTALENMGYTVKDGYSDNDLRISDCKYKEESYFYWITGESGLYHSNVHFDDSKVTLNNLKTYFTSILKYTYLGVDDKYTDYSVPDGKSKVTIYNSDGTTFIGYQPVSSSAPQMVPAIKGNKTSNEVIQIPEKRLLKAPRRW